MSKQKWLIAGLSLVMAATIGVGISACGKKEPDTPPTPEHTHEYTKWQHNETQHWMVCPADDAIWEQGKVDHTFKDGECECGYHMPEVYLVGTIASKPESHFPDYWQKLGKNVLNEVRANCIKMELGEDGKTYETEVLLEQNDRFRVYDANLGIVYPSMIESATGWGVEESNGYIVSWEKDKNPTWRVHDHDFTAYDKDENQHWKVCTFDGTAEPGVEKQDHDFTQGDCVCGQKAPEGCKHENGFAFAYTELPEANADGGTLQKTCPDCSATEDVHYDKGFGTACNTATGNKTVLTDAGTYYLRGTNGFRFETIQAGTYTFRFAGKLIPTMEDIKLQVFHIGTSYNSMFTNSNCAIQAGTNASKYNEQIAAYNVQIDGYASGAKKQFNSLTFTVKDSDVEGGKKVCVQVVFLGSNSTSSADKEGYLIEIECPAAASISAPAEVALLPEKKD